MSEVRVDLLSPMKIFAAHIIRIKLPKNIQNNLATIANTPRCLSICWLVGADIMHLLKKSFALIYLGGGPTTPFLPAGFCVIPHPFANQTNIRKMRSQGLIRTIFLSRFFAGVIT
jgi:hypothetical protein